MPLQLQDFKSKLHNSRHLPNLRCQLHCCRMHKLFLRAGHGLLRVPIATCGIGAMRGTTDSHLNLSLSICAGGTRGRLVFRDVKPVA